MNAQGLAGSWTRTLIQQQWETFIRSEPGTLRGTDPEDLHRMRVALRRLRTAIVAFAGSLPGELVALDADLQWVGRNLGVVRDLDVQIEALSHVMPADVGSASVREKLAHALRIQHKDAREGMVQCLTSSRFERTVLRVSRALQTDTGNRSSSMEKLAPRVLRASYRSFKASARDLRSKSKPVQLHRARKRLRRLRFIAEFVEEFYKGGAKDLIKACVELQDILGAHQDCYAAIATRRSLRRQLPKDQRDMLEALDTGDRKRAKKLRRRVPEAIRRVRRRWKSLK